MVKNTEHCLAKKLQEVYAMGLQIDHYTSSAHYPFGNLYVTYMDNEFELVNISLGTFPFQKSHTAENIFDSVEGRKEGILTKWGLEHIPRTYTTDNASNCRVAFQFKDKLNWLGCFAHTTHLIVKSGLEVPEVKKLLARSKLATNFFHSSTKGHLLLKENEEWLGFPDLTVLSECPTRWDSFLKSGKRMLEIKEPIVLTLHESNRPDLQFVESDWSLLHDLVKYFQEFHDATNTVSGNSYPTVNLIMPLLNKFSSITNTDKPLPFNVKNPEIIKKVRKAMHANLNKRYKDEDSKCLITVAACLDPRNILSKQYSSGECKAMLIKTTHLITLKNNEREQSQFQSESQSQINCTEGQELQVISGQIVQPLMSSTPKTSTASSSFSKTITSSSMTQKIDFSKDLTPNYVATLFPIDISDFACDVDDSSEASVRAEVDNYYK